MENSKTVLITGATSGIGLELAKLFANDKFSIIIIGRNESDLKETENLLSQLGAFKVSSIAVDLLKHRPQKISINKCNNRELV